MQRSRKRILEEALERNDMEVLRLYTLYGQTRLLIRDSKIKMRMAKAAYRVVVEEGEEDLCKRMELLTAYRQAKLMEAYHRLDFDLARLRLHTLLEEMGKGRKG